jgi:hypothetical protein
MVRDTFWVQYLFALLMLTQTDEVSDQSSELEKEMSRLERDVTRITELKQKNELRACQCYVSGYYIIHMSSL